MFRIWTSRAEAFSEGGFTSASGLSALPGFPVTEKPDELIKLKGLRVSFIVGEGDAIWKREVEVAHARLTSLGVESYLEVVAGSGHLLQPMFGGEFAERLQLLR